MKPRGYDLVSDEMRAEYDAIVEKMGCVDDDARLAVRAEWRKMRDRNGAVQVVPVGWLGKRGAPLPAAISRTTKASVFVVLEPVDGVLRREVRYNIDSGIEHGSKAINGGNAEVVAVSVPQMVRDAAFKAAERSRSWPRPTTNNSAWLRSLETPGVVRDV